MRSALLLLAMMLAPAALAAEIPVEHFAAMPSVRSPKVSPDGKSIAVMVRNDAGYYDIMVTSFGKNDFRVVASLKEAYDRIEWIAWANNDRLLVSASKPVSYSTFHFRTAKLYSIDVETGDSLQLTLRGTDRYSNFKHTRQAARNDDNVVSFLRDDPKHILVALRNENDTGPSVYKVNIYDNTFEKVVTNTYYVGWWYANLKGEVLLGIGFNPDSENDRLRRFWYRLSENDEWKMMREIEIGVDASFSPIGTVNEDGRILVFSDYKIGRTGLYNFNVKTGEFEDLVFAVDNYDVDTALLYEDRVIGAGWTEDYEKQHYFDPADAKLSELVKNTFRGAETYIASHDRARRKLVIAAERDDTPLKYYLLDREVGKASFWFSQYPELEKVRLAGKMPFEYKARDGMELNGYLTLPIGHEEKSKPPLVVLPHGGPYARDTRYFDYWAQFLAHRGYAVLQPNFRGSSGFGSDYESAGYRQWGQKMQDDVYDAVKWVKAKGYADTENACIVGASYGGYVALHAATKSPTMFKCYVSIAGISDIEKMVKGESRFFDSEKTNALFVGDLENENDVMTLRENSPINYAKYVERPILLIHGNEDTQVRLQQSEDFYDLARRLGKDVTFLRQENGTHYFDYGPHRLDAFKAIEEFLEDNLK